MKQRREPALGQARLTEHEQSRLPLGNQYTERREKPVMSWQCVKAAAVHYEVQDWTSRVDPELTYQENIELMRKRGTRRSMKEMPIRVIESRPK